MENITLSEAIKLEEDGKKIQAYSKLLNEWQDIVANGFEWEFDMNGDRTPLRVSPN